MNKKIIAGVMVIGIITVTAGSIYSKKSTNKTASIQYAEVSSNVVSNEGIHWHPELSIYIHGVKQVVPANIGIGKQYASSKWYDP